LAVVGLVAARRSDLLVDPVAALRRVAQRAVPQAADRLDDRLAAQPAQVAAVALRAQAAAEHLAEPPREAAN
jgi:hypothetical protein